MDKGRETLLVNRYPFDSIAYHFRFTEERDHERSQVAQIAEICQMCNKIAVDHGVAVVLTNQVTHKISGIAWLSFILFGCFQVSLLL